MTTTNTGYRWALETAREAALDLLVKLQPGCDRIEIAGSIRREKHSVKDIELVVLPKTRANVIPAVPGQLDLFGQTVGGSPARVDVISLLDDKLEEMARLGTIFKERPYVHEKGLWGARQKKFWIMWGLNGKAGYLPVDLFIVAPPAQWGPIFAIRTGPDGFNKALMNWINGQGFQQTQGFLMVRETGEVLDTPEERDYFTALGLRWIHPHDRTVERLQGEIRFNRAQEARAVAARKARLAEHEQQRVTSEQPSQDSSAQQEQPEIVTERKSATVADLTGGIIYTCDQDVRTKIRERLEERIGLS